MTRSHVVLVQILTLPLKLSGLGKLISLSRSFLIVKN